MAGEEKRLDIDALLESDEEEDFGIPSVAKPRVMVQANQDVIDRLIAEDSEDEDGGGTVQPSRPAEAGANADTAENEGRAALLEQLLAEDDSEDEREIARYANAGPGVSEPDANAPSREALVREAGESGDDWSPPQAAAAPAPEAPGPGASQYTLARVIQDARSLLSYRPSLPRRPFPIRVPASPAALRLLEERGHASSLRQTLFRPESMGGIQVSALVVQERFLAVGAASGAVFVLNHFMQVQAQFGGEDDAQHAAGGSGGAAQLRRHGGVTALAFSPNASYLAAGYEDGAVAVWEGPTWKLLRVADVSSRSAVVGLWFPSGDAPKCLVASNRGRIHHVGVTKMLWSFVAETKLVADLGSHVKAAPRTITCVNAPRLPGVGASRPRHRTAGNSAARHVAMGGAAAAAAAAATAARAATNVSTDIAEGRTGGAGGGPSSSGTPASPPLGPAAPRAAAGSGPMRTLVGATSRGRSFVVQSLPSVAVLDVWPLTQAAMAPFETNAEYDRVDAALAAADAATCLSWRDAAFCVPTGTPEGGRSLHGTAVLARACGRVIDVLVERGADPLAAPPAVTDSPTSAADGGAAGRWDSQSIMSGGGRASGRGVEGTGRSSGRSSRANTAQSLDEEAETGSVGAHSVVSASSGGGGSGGGGSSAGGGAGGQRGRAAATERRFHALGGPIELPGPALSVAWLRPDVLLVAMACSERLPGRGSPGYGPGPRVAVIDVLRSGLYLREHCALPGGGSESGTSWGAAGATQGFAPWMDRLCCSFGSLYWVHTRRHGATMLAPDLHVARVRPRGQRAHERASEGDWFEALALATSCHGLAGVDDEDEAAPAPGDEDGEGGEGADERSAGERVLPVPPFDVAQHQLAGVNVVGISVLAGPGHDAPMAPDQVHLLLRRYAEAVANAAFAASLPGVGDEGEGEERGDGSASSPAASPYFAAQLQPVLAARAMVQSCVATRDTEVLATTCAPPLARCRPTAHTALWDEVERGCVRGHLRVLSLRAVAALMEEMSGRKLPRAAPAARAVLACAEVEKASREEVAGVFSSVGLPVAAVAAVLRTDWPDSGLAAPRASAAESGGWAGTLPQSRWGRAVHFLSQEVSVSMRRRPVGGPSPRSSPLLRLSLLVVHAAVGADAVPFVEDLIPLPDRDAQSVQESLAALLAPRGIGARRGSLLDFLLRWDTPSALIVVTSALANPLLPRARPRLAIRAATSPKTPASPASPATGPVDDARLVHATCAVLMPESKSPAVGGDGENATNTAAGSSGGGGGGVGLGSLYEFVASPLVAPHAPGPLVRIALTFFAGGAVGPYSSHLRGQARRMAQLGLFGGSIPGLFEAEDEEQFTAGGGPGPSRRRSSCSNAELRRAELQETGVRRPSVQQRPTRADTTGDMLLRLLTLIHVLSRTELEEALVAADAGEEGEPQVPAFSSADERDRVLAGSALAMAMAQRGFWRALAALFRRLGLWTRAVDALLRSAESPVAGAPWSGKARRPRASVGSTTAGMGPLEEKEDEEEARAVVEAAERAQSARRGGPSAGQNAGEEGVFSALRAATDAFRLLDALVEGALPPSQRRAQAVPLEAVERGLDASKAGEKGVLVSSAAEDAASGDETGADSTPPLDLVRDVVLASLTRLLLLDTDRTAALVARVCGNLEAALDQLRPGRVPGRTPKEQPPLHARAGSKQGLTAAAERRSSSSSSSRRPSVRAMHGDRAMGEASAAAYRMLLLRGVLDRRPLAPAHQAQHHRRRSSRAALPGSRPFEEVHALEKLQLPPSLGREYVELLCRFSPHRLRSFVARSQAYALDEALALAEAHGAADAAALLHERMGDTTSALRLLLLRCAASTDDMLLAYAAVYANAARAADAAAQRRSSLAELDAAAEAVAAVGGDGQAAANGGSGPEGPGSSPTNGKGAESEVLGEYTAKVWHKAEAEARADPAVRAATRATARTLSAMARMCARHEAAHAAPATARSHGTAAGGEAEGTEPARASRSLWSAVLDALVAVHLHARARLLEGSANWGQLPDAADAEATTRTGMPASMAAAAGRVSEDLLSTVMALPLSGREACFRAVRTPLRDFVRTVVGRMQSLSLEDVAQRLVTAGRRATMGVLGGAIQGLMAGCRQEELALGTARRILHAGVARAAHERYESVVGPLGCNPADTVDSAQQASQRERAALVLPLRRLPAEFTRALTNAAPSRAAPRGGGPRKPGSDASASTNLLAPSVDGGDGKLASVLRIGMRLPAATGIADGVGQGEAGAELDLVLFHESGEARARSLACSNAGRGVRVPGRGGEKLRGRRGSAASAAGGGTGCVPVAAGARASLQLQLEAQHVQERGVQAARRARASTAEREREVGRAHAASYLLEADDVLNYPRSGSLLRFLGVPELSPAAQPPPSAMHDVQFGPINPVNDTRTRAFRPEEAEALDVETMISEA